MAKRHKFWALLGILIFLAVNYPLLQMANSETFYGGFPAVIFYLHVVWILAIVGLFALGRSLTLAD
ncbi:MAG: hypothetical protein ACOZF2_03125 [Thermodesulfobacteriota bacterium]